MNHTNQSSYAIYLNGLYFQPLTQTFNITQSTTISTFARLDILNFQLSYKYHISQFTPLSLTHSFFRDTKVNYTFFLKPSCLVFYSY